MNPESYFFIMLLLVFSCPEAFEFPFISKCLEGDHCILLDHACWYSSICLLVLLWFFFLCLLNFQCWKHWTLVIDLQEVMVISCIKKNHRHFFNRAKVNLARIIRFSCWLFQPGGICPSLCWSRDMRYEQAWLFLRGYLQDKPTW